MKNKQTDQKLQETLAHVSQSATRLTDDVVSLQSKIVHQENLTERLMIPMFVDVFQMFISHMSNVLDITTYSNVKQNLDRYLSLLQRARDGKHFLS